MGATTDLDLAGTGIKAGSQIAAGNERDQLERANAGIADQQVKSEFAAGSYNAGLARKKGAQITGTQVAAIGANNLTQGGTNAQVVADTAAAQESNALQIQNTAMRRAWGFAVQGASDTFQGKLARRGGMLSGIGSLISGGSKALDDYDENNPGP